MLSRLSLPAVFGACLLAGCSTLSSLNPFAKPDPKTAPAVLQEFKATMSAKSLWTANVGSTGNYVFSPANVGTDIYAASSDGTVLKLNAASGQVVWKIRAESGLTAGVAANAAAVAVAGEKGMVFVYNAQGALRWKAQASSEILTAPVIADGMLLVHSIDNRIAAYDVETGARKWMVERALPILTLRIVSGIAVKDQQAFVASPGGKLLALALQNGGLRWEASSAEAKGSTELERIVDMSGAPVVVGSHVCAVTYQGRVGCFDVTSGAMRWAKNISSEVGIAADERFVFAADNQGGVFAYAINGGSSVWHNDQLAFRQLSTPTSFGRAVVIGDRFGFVHFLSREDGAFVARVATDGSKIVSAPLIVGNNLVVQTKSGAIVAIATE